MKQLRRFRDLGAGMTHNITGRTRSIPHALIASILILTLVVQSGCATSESDKMPVQTLLLPLSRGAIQEFGNIGVASGRFAPKFLISSDVKTETQGDPLDEWAQAQIAAREKQARNALIFELPLFPLLLPVFVVALPMIPLAMWLEKPTEVQRQEQIQAIDKRLAVAREVVKTQEIQGELRDRIVEIGRGRTPYPFMALADWGPGATGERPDYRLLSKQGVQTVLEVVIEHVWIRAYEKYRRLTMSVTSRLVRTVDNSEIQTRRNVYDGRGVTFADWGEGQEYFRGELDGAFTEVATNLLKDIGFVGAGSK